MVKTALRILVLLLGLGWFAWFVWQAGPEEILRQVAGLGWLAPLVLVPYSLSYVMDTLGWFVAFGDEKKWRPAYPALFRVRWSGEAVNNVVPSAYIGGEAVKVYLLRKRGVPAVVSTASVVVAKTCQILAQVLFIGLGAWLGSRYLPADSPARYGLWFITGGAAMTIVMLFWLQRQGMFHGVRRLLGFFRVRPTLLERNQEALRQLDRQIVSFYHRRPARFLAATGAFFLGWMMDSLEVWLVCHLLGYPLSWPEALAIEAFITVAKAMGIFVPAALGVQESGVVLLFQIFGLPQPLGAAYAIIRRGRDVVFAVLGGWLLYSDEIRLRDLARRMAKEKQEPS